MNNSMIARIEHEILTSRRGRKSGNGIKFTCPDHDDHNPSAHWDSSKSVWHCFSCGSGSGWKDLAMKLNLSENYEVSLKKPCTIARTDQMVKKQHVLNLGNDLASTACTVEGYASFKNLPVDKLTSWGLKDYSYQGRASIRIPYFDENGKEGAVRYRIALSGKDKFRWKTGSKPSLYGLHRISSYDKKYVVLVEGESDCHTLWSHEVSALGIPGASTWHTDWEKYVSSFEIVYVLIEPDLGGVQTLKWIETSKIQDRVRLISLQGFKDPSDLHISDHENFQRYFDEALQRAISWPEHIGEKKLDASKEAWERCKELAQSSNILNIFLKTLGELGYVGDRRNPKLLFLILVSRLLKRPISVAVKGVSSSGKSYLIESVIKFFPKSAIKILTAMSEKTLIYTEDSLAHRMIYIAEANGMGGDFSNYILRSLLSEGRISYECVEKTSKGMHPRKIEKDGPTGLIVSTTKVSLHAENETRMLEMTVDDSTNQTRQVFRSIALEPTEIDFTPWHALQIWLESIEPNVDIPFALALADLFPPIAVRLRRDLTHILNLVRAHAIIHQFKREKTNKGEIIATFEDYSEVRDLVSDLISDGVGMTVSTSMLQTVEMVKKLIDAGTEDVSIVQLSLALNLDSSSVRRRAYSAMERGYLENRAAYKRPLKLTLGKPLPNAQEILPTVSDLARHVQSCTKKEEVGEFRNPLQSEVQ